MKLNRIVSAVVAMMFIAMPMIAQNASEESVGLVLSGGGAKGIAHIGVIKALEENDIPIDFVTGTSMGAIVGGLYACGYTPDEMMELIKSGAANCVIVKDLSRLGREYIETGRYLRRVFPELRKRGSKHAVGCRQPC